jgi:hypothetical protein
LAVLGAPHIGFSRAFSAFLEALEPVAATGIKGS